jgi:protein-S-isoprenylcysteine O-methyltransferase Ste14
MGEAMALVEEMQLQGSWLFRWRSYVPIILLAILLPPSLIGLHWPFGSYEYHRVWEYFCVAISLAGIGIRCATVGFVPAGTSGRGTTKQNARVLNTTGMYSLVRHPLYLGNYLVGLGVTLVWFDWWAPVIYSLCFWLYYERIMIAEEQFLAARFGEEFRQWAHETPVFFPSPSKPIRWRRASLPFSFRSTLRREYSTLVLIVALHTGMEGIENYWINGNLNFASLWGTTLIITVVTYVSLEIIKKRTQLLTVCGR